MSCDHRISDFITSLNSNLLHRLPPDVFGRVLELLCPVEGTGFARVGAGPPERPAGTASLLALRLVSRPCRDAVVAWRHWWRLVRPVVYLAGEDDDADALATVAALMPPRRRYLVDALLCDPEDDMVLQAETEPAVAAVVDADEHVRSLPWERGMVPETRDRLLCAAALHGAVRLAAAALAAGADPSAFQDFAVRAAARGGHLDVLELLLADPRVDVHAQNDAPWCEAIDAGHLAVVRRLLEAGVDPATQSQHAVRTAAVRGHADVLAELLQLPTVDPTVDGNMPVLSASSGGHADAVHVLICDSRVDPAAEHSLGLRWAATHGFARVVALLLADGRVDPSACNDVCMRKACELGHVDIVRLLLNHGVDPSAQHDQAIIVAAGANEAAVLELLLADARVDPMAQRGLPLETAAERGCAAAVQVLASDVRITASARRSASRAAKAAGFPEVVDMLAGPSVRTKLTSLLRRVRLG